MKYDYGSWHYEGDGFPRDSPQEYGAIHIGLFLKWCLLRGFAGRVPLDDWPEELAAVLAGKMSGTAFVVECLGEQLSSEDLNEEGNRFAEVYYGPKGNYLLDLDGKFGNLIYRAPESAYDFSQFSAVVDARFAGRLPDLTPPRKRWFGLF